MFVEAGYQVWTEAQILPEFDDSMSAAARGGVASGSARRMDVAAVPPDTSLTAHAADPSVLDGAAPEFLEAWCRSADAPCPLEAAENVKRVHYGDLAPRWKFHPCAHGTQGDMGPGAHACVKELSRLIATRRNGGVSPPQRLLDAVRREVYGRLTVSLMRELADQIIKNFATDTRRGLTAANKYTHSRFRAGARGGRSAAATCSCDSAHVLRFGCVCNAAAPRGGRPGGRVRLLRGGDVSI